LCPAAAELPACQPTHHPFGASVGESPVVGAEPAAVPAASNSSLFPSPPSPSHPHTLFTPPSRLRHLPAPHTQNKNALPGTTQQHLDGFGHSSAVAYPQHHIQPLCLAGAENLHFTLNGETRRTPGAASGQHPYSLGRRGPGELCGTAVAPQTSLGQSSIAPWTD
jgi:hypothetical protein